MFHPRARHVDILNLPARVQKLVDDQVMGMLHAPGSPPVDFCIPAGEEALISSDAVSWRVFRNPVALFVGGVAAVILELAEPKVRTGVWDHSSFRKQPMQRLQRTGMAAMVTVFGARSAAEKMIAGVVRRHSQVTGHTPAGDPYNANEVDLLTWVQATAGYGFAQAYHHYVRPLSQDEFDRVYLEGAPAAALYGALDAPRSDAQMQALFERMRSRLEPSPIIFEFLEIMRTAPILPAALRPVQRLMISAAVEITPAWVRERLGLVGSRHGLRSWEKFFVCWAGAASDRIMLTDSPAVQSCRRLGLSPQYLYRKPTAEHSG